jgi:predicted MFS family arabinose efflux permease
MSVGHRTAQCGAAHRRKQAQIVVTTSGSPASIATASPPFASLFLAALTPRFNRPPVLLRFSVLKIASDLIVANAASLAMLLTGRLLLRIALGGFWIMAVATTTRLVPSASVPRALAGAVSLIVTTGLKATAAP